ncbi:phosphatidylinositol synthase 1 (CDP-alcohol phosphatidyltransferase1) [Tilletia horrida]|nr:phosphatidylinositol synthase 1 (CDP-alcohol phosphatidyltransferase1) [Tilletia horrida]
MSTRRSTRQSSAAAKDLPSIPATTGSTTTAIKTTGLDNSSSNGARANGSHPNNDEDEYSPRSPAVSSRAATREANEKGKENVFLFVPNLIGYARVLLAALSLYFMKGNPKMCTVLYGISCLLDAFDGMAARALGQSTKFGAVLDMVTDRCTTSCLLCFLTSAYPNAAVIFQGLITLDFSSHYIHMYSSLLTGSKSHKIVTSDVSRILWYYYNDSRILFLFCAGNELFFVCLYLMASYETPLELSLPYLLYPLPRAVTAPLFDYIKNNPSTLLALFARELPTWTWPQIVGAITLPVCVAKQIINVVQFWKAAKVLVGVDLVERERARQKEAIEGR